MSDSEVQSPDIFRTYPVPSGHWLLVKFCHNNVDPTSLIPVQCDFICSRLWCFCDMYHIQLPSGRCLHFSFSDFTLTNVRTCSVKWAKKHFPDFFNSGDAIFI